MKTETNKKKTYRSLVSGITPSGGNLHIGNYFGAVKPHIELQDKVEEAYFFIADLHALTTVHDASSLSENIRNIVLDYLALGLDPEKVVFFRQSQVPEHSELAVILGNYVSFGHMQRMHAFKDKLEKDADVNQIRMGLFNYPILMAADILLYKPDAVPVGEDQRQHVEITRDMAESFNKTYAEDFFPLPDVYTTDKTTARLVGTDGERKMSKSLGNIIGIFSEPDVIRKQIMGCFTDPNRVHADDPGRVEGNPVFIYHDLLNDNHKEVADLKARYREGKVGDVEVKEKLFVAHQRYFATAVERREKLCQDDELLRDILEEGRKKAASQAEKNLLEIKKIIGLV